MDIFTIGVYGSSENVFFEKIKSAGVTLFVDVRARRGMRGALYSFANSNRLQAKLAEIGVSYLHLKDLAPSKDIRYLQRVQDHKDLGKRLRTKLSLDFCNEYESQVLSAFDMSQLTDLIVHEKICLFCVERDCEACHRSLISKRLSKLIDGLSVIDL